MEKKNLFKKMFSFAVSCMVVMSLAGPAFALDEMPTTVKPTADPSKSVSLFKNEAGASGGVPTFGAMTTSTNKNFEVFCLNREAYSPTEKDCTEANVKDLAIKTYDEEILKVLLNYPILSDTVNCPHITSDKYKSVEPAAREYFFRQTAIWYYQSLIDTKSAEGFKTEFTDKIKANGDADSKLLLTEIMNFVEKVRTKQIVLAKENSIKIYAPSTELALNEKTGYYESAKYVVDIKGCVGNGAVVTELNLPEYMEAVNADTGKVLAKGEVVDQFIIRVAKDQIDRATASKDIASLKVATSYTDAAYKVYKYDSSGQYQDVGVIVKEVKSLSTDTVVSVSVKQTSAPKEDTKKNTKKDTTSAEQTDAPNTGDSTKHLPYLFLTTVTLGAGYVFLSKKLKNKG